MNKIFTLSLALGLVLFSPSFSYASVVSATSSFIDSFATTSSDDSISTTTTDTNISSSDSASSTGSTTLAVVDVSTTTVLATSTAETQASSTATSSVPISVPVHISPNLIREYEAFESVASSSKGTSFISADDQALLSSEMTGVTPDRLLGLKLSMLNMLLYSPHWPRYSPHSSYGIGQHTNSFTDVIHQIITMNSGKDFPALDKKIHQEMISAFRSPRAGTKPHTDL